MIVQVQRGETLASNAISSRVFTELHGMKAQCFSFGMKFRPLGKGKTPKIDLTFSPKCSIILTTIWATFSPCTYLCAGVVHHREKWLK